MFKLKESFIKKYSTVTPPFGFNGLGEITYLRTYSRLKKDGTKEQWYETVQRVVEGCYSIQKRHILDNKLGWNDARADESAQEMYDRIFNMKFLPPGRSLWAMGTSIVEEKGLYAALQNCAFVSTENIDKHPTKPFEFMMDMSMLGVGVGFDTKGADKIQIKKPMEGFEMMFFVPDTREGWVEGLKLVLEAYFKGSFLPVFDYSLIRPEGAPIKTFGGKASGHKPLEKLYNQIIRKFRNRIDTYITSTDIVDVMNMIGACVVAGNVRRSAQLVIGDPADDQYLKLKDYQWNGTEYVGSASNRAEYGWTSNNTINATIGMDYTELAKQTAKNGEPGYIWMDNVKKFSRMSEPEDNKDSKAVGTNPCFHPDTLIETINGRVKIKDIKKPTFVYSMDNNGKLCIQKASASFVSKKDAEVIKITLRNGSFLIVTSDHKVYTKNRGWVEAGKLGREDVLVHLNRSRRGKRYSGVKLNTQDKYDYIMEHRLVYQGVNGLIDDNHDIHHIDGNTFNNSIENLKILNHNEHSKYTAINDNPQKHQIRNSLGRFIAPITKYLSKIQNVPEELKTNLLNQFSTTVYCIERYGKTDVYDIQVENTNCLLANNIVAHNCGEQTLESFEMCCLVETFPTRCTDLEDFKRTLKFAYLYGKTVTLSKTHWIETNRVMLRNRRIGTSVSGIAQFIDKQGLNELKTWLNEGYNTIQHYDKIYSDWLAVPKSIKTTSIKPLKIFYKCNLSKLSMYTI